jgi:nucleoside-diphosphate-sugar epimerase
MRVFVTGAAGFIGRSVVRELLDHGHKVLGLARSDANAEILNKAGAEVHRGDLKDVESLKAGVRATDGVIHLAFVHDFSDFAGSAKVDREAIQAMAEAIVAKGKENPLVIASGTLGVTSGGKLATEDDDPERNGSPMAARYESGDLVYSLSKTSKGLVRGSVVRLAPVVHGAEDWGFIPMLVGVSRKNGRACYLGDGSARWPAVHKLDAAVIFRLALEKGTAGATYNAVAEQGIPVKDIVTKIGERLQLPVESLPAGPEAAETLGLMAHLLAMDSPTSSDKTQKELGWKPSHLGLLADMEANYFS